MNSLQEKKELRKSFCYPRALPLNFHQRDEFRFTPISECEVSAAFLQSFQNVKVCQYYLFSGTTLLEDYCLPIQKRGKVNTWKQWVKLQLFPEFSVDTALWVTDTWSKNYFHWILECLPRILAIRKLGINSPILLPEHIYNASYVQDSIRDFGLEAITFNFRQTVRVKELLLPSHDSPCAFDPEYLNLVVQGYQKLDSPKESLVNRKVYITRRGALKRKIDNEEELIPFLEKRGFELVQMESLSFRQQRELMRETKVLLSLHGAGLANMIFMPKDSIIIELHPDVERYNSCFYHLASALGIKYCYSFEKGDHPNPQEANIKVDLANLQSLLNGLI